MKFVFLSNFLSHHQIPFSEAMLADTEYHFVAAGKVPDERTRLGYRAYSEDTIPYLVEIDGDDRKYQQVMDMTTQADIAIIGSAPFSLVEPRIAQGKLTFVYSERLFKKLSSLAILVLRGILVRYYLKPGHRQNVYLLSASAYVPNDLRPFGAFRNRIYKWGYFPGTQTESLKEILQEKSGPVLQILWVGRLIPYKRPQYALYLARKLKEQGYRFQLTIIGNGVLEADLKARIAAARLEDVVHMAGAMPPDDVRKAMNRADIFLYTANRQEGWGAVLNEAMNSACGVVCCREIGSAPYLVKDGHNGLLFDGAIKSQMVAKVRELMDDQERRRKMGEQAYHTITDVWNAEEAARRLKILCESLQETGDCTQFEDGPCSKASITR